MCLSCGRQRRVIHLFALPSLPFCFRTHCLSSEVVRAADTYQQEVDTLNLTPTPPTPVQIRAGGRFVYVQTAVCLPGCTWLND